METTIESVTLVNDPLMVTSAHVCMCGPCACDILGSVLCKAGYSADVLSELVRGHS